MEESGIMGEEKKGKGIIKEGGMKEKMRLNEGDKER